MNTSNNPSVRGQVLVALLIFSFLVSIAGCRKSKGVPDSAEYSAVEVAISQFLLDWGLPKNLAAEDSELLPNQCFLVNRFHPVDKWEISELRAKIVPEEMDALEDMEKKNPNYEIPSPSVHCEVIPNPFSEANQNPWKSLKKAARDRVGILQISRVGIDIKKNHAILLLSESRADIAGSVWAIHLRRDEKGWQIVGRTLLTQS